MAMEVKKYIEDPLFKEFILREFRNIAKEATIEELAEFAFGDMNTAIKAFNKETNNEN